MRAPGDWPPALRAVAAVAATCLLMVMVAWATVIGPDEVFTGPGPQPSTVTTTETCVPLPVVTRADGTVEVQYPDDYALDSDYCPPPAEGLDDYRDLVDANPMPVWMRILLSLFLLAVLLAFAAFVWVLVSLAVRRLLARRGSGRREAVETAPLAEDARISEEVTRDAEEQDALLQSGDARNAIVATWHRFEVQGERAGVARAASETSSEYALRVLDLADADSASVNRLAALYREARFSDHPITEEHRADALAALSAIRQSLGVRS